MIVQANIRIFFDGAAIELTELPIAAADIDNTGLLLLGVGS